MSYIIGEKFENPHLGTRIVREPLTVDRIGDCILVISAYGVD